MSNSSRWERSQKSESRCWGQNLDKVNSPNYKQYKREYWEQILDALPVDGAESKRLLDFGCGPSGVVMALSDNENMTCMDPLMDMYMENHPYLKEYKAQYYSGKIEDFQADMPFEIILGFNSLDHVDNIQEALKQIARLSDTNTTLVFTLNCHTVPRIRNIVFRWSRILDKPHPHQYTVGQYADLIEAEGYDVVDIIDVDDETHWINKMTASPTKKRSWKSRLQPGNVFFKTVEKLTGLKRYGSKRDSTVFVHRAFVCKLSDKHQAAKAA